MKGIMQTKPKGLRAKDLITTGIFTVLYFAVIACCYKRTTLNRQKSFYPLRVITMHRQHSIDKMKQTCPGR
jgi:hypothetical protein